MDSSVVEKTWGAIYDGKILLQEETEEELREEIRRTRVPDGTEVLALPKPYHSMIV